MSAVSAGLRTLRVADDRGNSEDRQSGSAGFLELTREALTALQSAIPAASAAVDHDEAYGLRGKILGVLLRQGRLAAQLTPEDCALYLGVEADLIEAWELGASVPSLPQLEELAGCFEASGAGEAWRARGERSSADDEYARLRQRLVGALLQSARWAKDRSYADISAKTGLETELLVRYEFGEITIPVHHLMVLAGAVQRDLGYFAEMDEVSLRRSEPLPQRGQEANDDWDVDLRQFAADRRNRAVIRLAMAFRDIDREDLDRVASALLAIVRDKRDAGSRPQP